MLEQFHQELAADSTLNPKHVPYYIRWVRESYSFFRLSPNVRLTPEQRRLFLTHLEKSRETWQVKQADSALARYDYFLSRVRPANSAAPIDPAAWLAVADKTRDILRLKHHALNTEKTYLGWLRQFQNFLSGKPPGEVVFDDRGARGTLLAIFLFDSLCSNDTFPPCHA